MFVIVSNAHNVIVVINNIDSMTAVKTLMQQQYTV